MKIDKAAFELALARNCKTSADYRNVVSSATLTRIRSGYNVTTKTVGKLAYALGVDPYDLIEKED